MSDLPSRLPERASLEQLRKQAKDLLRGARGGDDAALALVGADQRGNDLTLADAQHGLARHYGFPGWTALRRHVETLRPPGLVQFERLAAALSESYRSGDRAALRELNWTYGTGFPTAPPSGETPDTRLMVAQSYGFENWKAFAEAVHGPPAGLNFATACMSQSPPFYTIDRLDDRMLVRGPVADDQWDALAAVFEERGLRKLTAPSMTDSGMRRIARLTRLTTLDVLNSRQLTDEGAASLADMPQLADVSIGGWSSPLTDRTLASLGALTALRRIHSPWTPGLSDTGAARLAGCDLLEDVAFLGAPVGDGLLRAMAGKSRLRKLVTGREVTDAGLSLLHEIPGFGCWRGGDIRYRLTDFSASPTHLSIDGPFTDAGLASLAGLDGLFSLNLFWHSPRFSAAGLAALGRLPRLAVLGLDGKSCDDEAMAALARLPALRKLIAQGTVASDAGFATLSTSPTLEYLWGRECPNLNGRGFAALAMAPALKGLAVSCRNVDDAALSLLPEFPALRELLPMDVNDAGFIHVGRCRALEHLWCMYCRDTGDAATESIASLRLKSYYAGSTRITDRSLQLLAGMESLERIELDNCPGLTDAGIGRLAPLPNLQELVLDGLAKVTSRAPSLFGSGVQVRYVG